MPGTGSSSRTWRPWGSGPRWPPSPKPAPQRHHVRRARSSPRKADHVSKISIEHRVNTDNERAVRLHSGLHGHSLEHNTLRASLAEAVGTFVLVLTIISSAIAATLARPIAGAAYSSVAVAVAVAGGAAVAGRRRRSRSRIGGPSQPCGYARAGGEPQLPMAVRPRVPHRPTCRCDRGGLGGMGVVRRVGAKRRPSGRHRSGCRGRRLEGLRGGGLRDVRLGPRRRLRRHRQPGAPRCGRGRDRGRAGSGDPCRGTD